MAFALAPSSALFFLLVRYYYWICFCVWTALAGLNSALTGPCGCVSVLARLDVGCSAHAMRGLRSRAGALLRIRQSAGQVKQWTAIKAVEPLGPAGIFRQSAVHGPFSNSHGFSVIIIVPYLY
jgi:hypothetical protein